MIFSAASPHTAINNLSLHDALPICDRIGVGRAQRRSRRRAAQRAAQDTDRKSTRLNSSHVAISYAVFCLKKKNHLARRSPATPHHKLAAGTRCHLTHVYDLASVATR